MSFDDNCISILYNQLCNDNHKNTVVQDYLYHSPRYLRRTDFFLYLWENNQFDDILHLIEGINKYQFNIRLIQFQKEMSKWVDKYLMIISP